MEHISLQNSIVKLDSLSYEEYSQWIDRIIKLNSQSALFYYVHLTNYIQKYETTLGLKKYVYLEKLFYSALELKLLAHSAMILKNFATFFGKNEPKILMLQADMVQITEDTEENALSTYSKLFTENQHDRINLKNYIYLKKKDYVYSDLKLYIDLLNEYLKICMDDAEIWQELADIYILTMNYNKAIFCLEEVILHTPNNYLLYIKIGDMLNSFNNTEASSQALKYYAKSILIKPSPRAYWGIIFIENLYKKYKKPIDGQLKSSINIAHEYLNKLYPVGYIEKLYGIHK